MINNFEGTDKLLAFFCKSRHRHLSGRVAEWLKAAVLKTAVRASVPWVRIPPLPPKCLLSLEVYLKKYKAF